MRRRQLKRLYKVFGTDLKRVNTTTVSGKIIVLVRINDILCIRDFQTLLIDNQLCHAKTKRQLQPPI
jgi:hypothetical protein